MKRRRLGSALYPLTLIIMLTIISGCSEKNETKQQSAETAFSENKNLRIVQSLSSPQRTEYLNQLIQDYELKHPHIKIELVTPEYDTADQTILTMLEEEQKADIVEVRDSTVQQLALGGHISSLEPHLGDGFPLFLLNKNALSLARDVEGIVYYIPCGLYELQLFYRKDLFEAKALQVPETWGELYQVGKLLTRPENHQYGWAYHEGESSVHTFTHIIRNYNGQNVDPYDSMFRIDGSTIFSALEAVEALELYRSIYLNISPRESIEWGLSQQVQAFVDGKAAMFVQGSIAGEQISQQLKPSAWAAAPLPAGPEGISHYHLSAAGWGISSYSEYQQEAWDFIAYISTVQNNALFAKAAGAISVYSNMLDNEIYKTGPYASFNLMEKTPSRYKAVKPPSHYENYNQHFQLITASMVDFLKGFLSAEELLHDLDQFWTQQKEMRQKKEQGAGK